MKNILSSILLLGIGWCANAQHNLILTDYDPYLGIGFTAEHLSSQKKFAAGANAATLEPAIWDISTNEVITYSYTGEYTGINGDTGEPLTVEDPYIGDFLWVTNKGTAVGSFGTSVGENRYAAMANIKDDTVTYLYYDPVKDAGTSAYMITEDEKTILGFYFDDGWVTRACYWTNGGKDRHDLPVPTEEEFGGPVDYISARWMSEDGSVILGYAQDTYNGAWVIIYWTRDDKGEYIVHGEYAREYFTPYSFDKYGNIYFVHQDKKYMGFQPQALSANGKWVTLEVTETIDLNDPFANPHSQAARLNLDTKKLEILDRGEDAHPLYFSVANDGTAVGATPMNAEMTAPREGHIWPIGLDYTLRLQDLYPEIEFFNYEYGDGSAVISSITPDGKYICGFVEQITEDDEFLSQSYLIDVPTVWPSKPHGYGIEEVISNANESMKTIYNGQLIIIRDGKAYNAMGQQVVDK